MEGIFYAVAVIFSFIGLGCVFLVVIGLPGIWIMLVVSLIVEYADRFYLPPENQQTFSWKLLILCLILAIIAEALEFFVGVLGAKKAGASKNGMIGAVAGGFIGAFLGTGIPIPVLGTFFGAAIGTFIGALIGEMKSKEARTRNTDEYIKPAFGAAVARIIATLTKIPIAITVWISLSIAAFWK